MPGRVLVETGPGVETTFTVEPEGGQRSRVRLDTVLEAGGLMGLMIRLGRYARAHPPLAPAV